MKFTEFKNKLKNSLAYEFCYKIINFFKDFKFMSIILFLVIVAISACISPFVNKSIQQGKYIEQSSLSDSDNYKEYVTVYVTGNVNKPGVYTLTSDDRIKDAIKMAGGAKSDAYLENINLAQKLSDEQYINVPSVSEVEKSNNTSSHSSSSNDFRGIVNINTATSAELQQLPGIGSGLAEGIIEYRTNAGNFVDKRDIMNVKGIGESLYHKIKDHITI